MGGPRLSAVVALALLLAGCTAPPSKVNLPDIHGLAVDPSDPDVLYIATHRGLFRGEAGGDWTAVTREPFDMMGFTLEPGSGTMYASGHPSMGGLLGFARSTDRGETWHIISLEGQVDFHAMTVSVADPNRVWGYWRDEVMRSDDGGLTWVTLRGATPPPSVASLASHATDPNTLFAGGHDGLHVSRDGGATFVALREHNYENGTPSLPLHSYSAVATSVADPQLVLAHEWRGLVVSRDGGSSWHVGGLAMEPLEQDEIAALAIDPTDPNVMYAGSYRGLIWKSVDGGGNWTVVL